jgi:hypothetical protein
MGECKQIASAPVNYFIGTFQWSSKEKSKSSCPRNAGGQPAREARSILLLVPPLAEGTAAAIFIQRGEEDAVELSVEAGRHNNKGRPPASNSLLGSYGENFVSELNVLLGVGSLGPIFEDGWPSAHGFEERGDLIGAVFGEKIRGGLRVAAFPRAAVGI